MKKPQKHVTVLSLGAGIQSTALALLLDQEALEGCPKPLWAIFADTKSEPPHVYQTLDWLQERISYPIVRTSWGDLAKNTWKAITGMPVPERGHHQPGYIDLPVFSETGIGRRQCTSVYKVRPIKQEIRRLAQSAPPHLTATQYLGISANETRAGQTSPRGLDNQPFPPSSNTAGAAWTAPSGLTSSILGHPVMPQLMLFLPVQKQRRLEGDSRPLSGPLPGRDRDGPADGRTPQGSLAASRRGAGEILGRDPSSATIARHRRSPLQRRMNRAPPLPDRATVIVPIQIHGESPQARG